MNAMQQKQRTAFAGCSLNFAAFVCGYALRNFNARCCNEFIKQNKQDGLGIMIIEKFLATSAAFFASPFCDAAGKALSKQDERDLSFSHKGPREQNRARHRRTIERAMRAASGNAPHHPSRMR
jgi:hypothetical protein